MKRKSLFFPVLLIGIGLVVFLINVGFLHGTVWGFFSTWWPVLLLLAGLDGLYTRSGWVGPLVLIGLGGVMLAGNLGYVPQNAWHLLLQLWPIFLVGIGLDLVIGSTHSTWAAIGRVFLGLLLIAGLFWLAMGIPGGNILKPMEIHQPLDNTTSAQLEFNLAAGKFYLQPGQEKDVLIAGTASLPEDKPANPLYNAPKDGWSYFALEAPAVSFGDQQSQWDLTINSQIPIDLKASMGAGEMNLDLRGTHVKSLDSKLGAGKMEVSLPANQDVNGSINNAIGTLILRVPACADVKLRVERGLTELILPAGYRTQDDEIINQVSAGCMGHAVNLDLSLAIGALQIIQQP